MALALTLIVGAGLLLQGLRTLRAADTGVDTEGVVALDLYMNPQTHPADIDLWNVYSEILSRVRALPGVAAAGMGEEIPVSGGYGCTVQGFEDESVYDRVSAAGMTTCAGQERVTPGYFEALGIPILEGRALDDGDHADPRRASVVVSRAFAERFWPGESAIGKGVAPSGRTIPPYYRVVGVAGDVARQSDPGQPPLSQQAIAIYYPVMHDPDTPGNWGWWWAGNMTLVVRTDAADPLSAFPAIRQVIRDIGPEIPVADARSMEEVVKGAVADIGFVSLLMAIAAGMAIALAAVGLYGVVAYVVSRRTREIGMRLAIGAEPGTVIRSVVGQTLVLAGGGILVGIPLALLTSRVGRSVLVGVEPTEPTAYLVGAAVLVLVALAASWLPARRAAAVDPVTALRTD
jgi:predicted permease